MAEGMNRIDLNVDLAEGAPWDDELIAAASTVNICCGAHAGSPELARRTAANAFREGVRLCLHPGYEDREGMGRQSMPNISSDELAASLMAQADVLEGFQIRAVKPHGGLYHDSSQREPHAAALTALLARVQQPLIGSLLGLHPRIAAAAGVEFISEQFADRGRLPDGSLIPRGEPGDLIDDPRAAADAALALADSCQTLCLHGDREGSPERLRAVRRALEEAGWTIGP